MNTVGTLWLILTASVFCLGLATFLRVRKTPVDSFANDHPPSSDLPTHTPIPKQKIPMGLENIRQIGLIEKDEFAAFYQPVIEQVSAYSQSLTGKALDPDYFETLYKALRKRRAAIFEFGSSEVDHAKRATWTYALFAAVSIRYVAARMGRYTCSAQGREAAGPLMSLAELASARKTPQSESVNCHAPSTLNIHFIDKILPTAMIEILHRNGVYATFVNAVTGHYFQPLSPFYRIIEDVERHVNRAPPITDQTVFMQTLNIVLDGITRDIFSKNNANSLIFEGRSYLLIDRCLLWEFFRSYHIAEQAPLSKNAFERMLTKQLGIEAQLDSIIQYTVQVVSEDNAPVTLELRTMLALPYQKIPLYLPTKPIGIGRQVINRDVLVGDRESDTAADPSSLDEASASADQTPSREGKEKKVIRTSNEKPVVVGDLFSSA